MQKHGIWFKNFVEEQDANWQTEAIRTAFLGWCTVQIVANAFPIQAHSHSTDQMEKPMMRTVVFIDSRRRTLLQGYIKQAAFQSEMQPVLLCGAHS